MAFHVMYGTFYDATEEEMKDWRTLGVRFIRGEVDFLPLNLATFREWQKQQLLGDTKDGSSGRR